MRTLSAIKCIILVKFIKSWAFEEIPAPNLSRDQKYFQPWPSLEQQLESVQERTDSEPVLWETPRTLHQNERSQRRMDGQTGLFLPGLGIVKEYVPSQREQDPYKR